MSLDKKCTTCRTPLLWCAGKLVCPKKSCPQYSKEA